MPYGSSSKMNTCSWEVRLRLASTKVAMKSNIFTHELSVTEKQERKGEDYLGFGLGLSGPSLSPHGNLQAWSQEPSAFASAGCLRLWPKLFSKQKKIWGNECFTFTSWTWGSAAAWPSCSQASSLLSCFSSRPSQSDRWSSKLLESVHHRLGQSEGLEFEGSACRLAEVLSRQRWQQ